MPDRLCEVKAEKSTSKDAPKSANDKPKIVDLGRDIDNPGGGNCAFYAFVIGLIYIIQQKEAALTKNVFARWVARDSKIASEYENILNYNFNKPNDALLNVLQKSLREIIYQEKLDELKHVCSISRVINNYKHLSNSNSYTHFSCIYFGDRADVDPKYNEFAASYKIQQEIKKLKTPISYKTALARLNLDSTEFVIDKKAIKEKFKADFPKDKLSVEGETDESFAQRLLERKKKRKAIIEEIEEQKINNSSIALSLLIQEDPKLVIKGHETLTLAPLFMSLFYGNVAIESITKETKPQESSLIVDAMQLMRQERFWGTHIELNYLADVFHVNFHPLRNGQALWEYKDDPERSNVTVNNKGNCHWTTMIPMPVGSRLIDEAKNAEKPQEEKRTAAVLPAPRTKVNRLETVTPSGKWRSFFSFFSLGIPATKQAPTVNACTAVKPEILYTHRVAKVVNQQNMDSQKRLERLQLSVNTAVTAYCSYSESIWISIWHRHWRSGRERAKAFGKSISEHDDYFHTLTSIIEFLEDKTKGNTHPHSFRTMLLQELLNTNNHKFTLQEISHDYKNCLNLLKEQLNYSSIKFYCPL
ncbi:MAG: hypothetical protein QM652_09820 [Legionella sp.]|uniref:hypothetical protein n=1 Tax=Legionella sp. TaxID=459 RepID=UPI0039E3CE74